MRKTNYKGRCEKKVLSKCKTLFKSYDPIQLTYADSLDANPNIIEIQCNVPLEDNECNGYMTDFLCTLSSGEYMVREVISSRFLCKPLSVKLLDLSRSYWLRRGVADWGIVTDAAEE